MRALLPIALVVASACQLLPSDVAKQLLPERSDYKTLEAAYHVLLERHVDRPGSDQLLTGALNGANAYLQKPTDQKGASCSGVSAAKPTFTGAAESDLLKTDAALDQAAQQCPSADKVQLERAATDGMAKSMNECHTYYLDPDRAREFNGPPQPYSGIGATLLAPSTQAPAPSGAVTALVQISAVFPGSPAEKAGIRPGDRVKVVDGTDVSGYSPDEVATRIRGPEGTRVKLVLLRGTQELSFTITRVTLTPPRVTEREWDNGKIVELSISQLNGDVAKQTQDSVERAIKTGAQGFVLDLRNDPGGDLSAAVDIASIFLKDATLVEQVEREGKKEALRTNNKMYIGFNGPVVVLVNERSASGSEIIAAGLRSNGAAEVVGTRTAGCVGIAQPRQMPDEGLLLVTLARMEDEKTGEPLNGQGRGVAPDLAVKTTNDDPEADLTAAIDAARQRIAQRPAATSHP